MRILHLTAPARYGGLERVVEMLVRGQTAAGHDVHVAAVVDAGAGDHPFPALVEAAGATAHPLEVPLRGYRVERRLVREMCDTLDPDVVHTHGYRIDVLHGAVPGRLGIPRVTTVHGFTGGGLKNRVYEALQQRSFRRADAVVAVSGPLERELRAGLGQTRLHVIRNAWVPAPQGALLTRSQARVALGIWDDAFHLGFVGRLGREKGADVFVEALGRLDGDRYVASVLGTGTEEEALTARARSLGVDERIRWHGFVANAGSYLTALDIFVLSSRTEGTPIALLEAIAAGVPVVATRVGGVPDVVSDREALLVEPERPDQLAEAIREVQRQPAEARERARRARERIEREFAAEAWVARYDEVYRQAIERRRQDGR